MSLRIHRYERFPDAEGTIRSLAGADPAPLWLVPSGADREELAARLAPRGSFGPRPEILLWGGLLRHLVDGVEARGVPVRRRRAIDPPDHHLILRFLLRRLRAEEEARPEGERIPLPPATRREGFLSLLSEGVKELIREDASPELLAAALEGAERPGATPLLARLHRDYRDYLEERGLIDAAAVPAEIRRLLTDPGTGPAARAVLAERPLAAVGFLSFFGGELGALRALAAATEVRLLQPRVLPGGFRDASAQLEADADSAEDLPPGEGGDFLEFRAPDPDREAEGLARLLALWAAGAGDLLRLGPFPGWSRIGIRLSGGAGAILPALRRYRIPFRRAGTSAAETLPHDGAIRSLQAAPLWPVHRAASLLARAALGGARLDAAGIARTPDGLAGARALARRGGSRAEAALERAREFVEAVRRGGTAEVLLRALRRFAVACEEELDREEPLRADGPIREAAAYREELDRKILSLSELTPDLGPAGEERLSGAEALSFLSVWAEETTLSRPPATEAVSLLTGSPAPLVHFDLLILTGVTARVWPGSLAESPLLGEALRERLNGTPGAGAAHLPTLPERRSQREALFRRLAASARSAAFFAPESDEMGRPLPRSPLPAALARDGAFRRRTPGDRPLPIPRGIPDPTDPHFPAVQVTSATGTAPRGPFPRVLLPPREAIPRTVRLSNLDALLDCPYAWACDQILRLSEPGRALFDAARAGTLLHRVWQRVFREITREGAEPDPADPPILDHLSRAFDEGVGDPDYGYAELGREARLDRQRLRLREGARALAAFLELSEGNRRSRFPRVEIRLESDLPPLAATPKGGGDPFLFSGRADRLDRLLLPGAPKGALLIWDYKLGRAKGRDRGSLQLPAYALALAGAGERIAGWAYLGQGDARAEGSFADPELARAVRNVRVLRGVCSPEALEERLEEARAGLARAAGILASGRFEANYDSERCGRCPWRGLCRRGEERGEAPEEESEGTTPLDGEEGAEG